MTRSETEGMYCGEGLVDFGRGDRERGGEYPAAVVFYVEGGLAVVRDELAGDGGEDGLRRD